MYGLWWVRIFCLKLNNKGAADSGAPLFPSCAKRVAPRMNAQATQSYHAAVDRLHQLQARETDEVNPLCRTQLLAHGYKTARVIIFLHGFTNCPHQFCQLAPLFYTRGYTVLVMRLPEHGFANRLTTALARLTAQAMIDLTNEAIDIAHGLGEHVTLFGFSLGGILAGWAAQQRADLDQAVLVSPAIGIRAISVRRRPLAAKLLTRLPNFFRWWDAVAKAARVGPAHAYPRYASRSLGALLQLGNMVQQAAPRSKPLVGTLHVITNPCDDVVDNTTVAAVVEAWRKQGANVQTHEFPATWRLIHDLIDPAQPAQQVARVYPQLLEWIDGGK